MNKTVLITGAYGGIGRETAIVFAEAGWQVVATGRKQDKADFVHWPTITTFMLDVTDTKSIAACFDAVTKTHHTIDVVINNAGYGLEGAFEALDEQMVRNQFETNVFGLMNVTRAAIAVMRPQKSGVIIQLASMGGRITFPLYSVYHASKWAVEGFTESLQYELAMFNIRLKLIEPGAIKTAFYTTSRLSNRPLSELGYDEYINKIEKIELGPGQTGDSPSKVARTIYRAATDGKTKLRYAVGSPAPFLLFMRKLLPDRLFFYGIRSRFKN
jgi:NAD(P)-dependent dehydrogenase (short-subunit alcohol dehydrogenase family)